jgi:hypothetical protein
MKSFVRSFSLLLQACNEGDSPKLFQESDLQILSEDDISKNIEMEDLSSIPQDGMKATQ